MGLHYRLIHNTEFLEAEVMAKDEASNLAILRLKTKHNLNFLKFANWNDVITPGTEILSICHLTSPMRLDVSYNCVFSERICTLIV